MQVHNEKFMGDITLKIYLKVIWVVRRSMKPNEPEFVTPKAGHCSIRKSLSQLKLRRMLEIVHTITKGQVQMIKN